MSIVDYNAFYESPIGSQCVFNDNFYVKIDSTWWKRIALENPDYQGVSLTESIRRMEDQLMFFRGTNFQTMADDLRELKNKVMQQEIEIAILKESKELAVEEETKETARNIEV